MAQSKNRTILVNDIEISISSINEQDYISLPACAKRPTTRFTLCNHI